MQVLLLVAGLALSAAGCADRDGGPRLDAALAALLAADYELKGGAGRDERLVLLLLLRRLLPAASAAAPRAAPAR